MRGWLRTVLALVVAATAIATAHAEQIADRFEQAREEGVVVVYAATDLEVVKPVIDDFEALHPGVRVQYHDMHSAELHARVVNERRRGVAGADVAWSFGDRPAGRRLIDQTATAREAPLQTAAAVSALRPRCRRPRPSAPAGAVVTPTACWRAICSRHAGWCPLLDREPASLRSLLAADPRRLGLQPAAAQDAAPTR